MQRSYRLLQAALLLGFIAMFSTAELPVASAAKINTTSQIATTTFRVDASEAYALASAASTLDVIDPATETVTSSISLGIPASQARDMDWSESEQAVFVSTSNGLVLKVDPVTEIVTTHASVSGADFAVLGTDSHNAGTSAWVVDANTNILYDIKTDGSVFSAGPLSQGGPIGVHEMAVGAQQQQTFIAALFDDSATSLQMGTVVDLYDTGIYVFVGGWGREGKPKDIDVEGGHAVIATNTGTGGSPPANILLFDPILEQFYSPFYSSSGHEVLGMSVAGDGVVTAIVEDGVGAKKLAVFDMGDPANVLHAGEIVIASTSSGGLSTAVVNEGGTLDDLRAVSANTTSEALLTTLDADALVNGSTDPIDPHGSGTTPANNIAPDLEVYICDCDPDSMARSPGGTTTNGAVQFATGEEKYTVPLFSTPGVGLHADFALTYRSRSDSNYRYGRGWFLNQDKRVKTETSGDVTYYNGLGRRDLYLKSGSAFLPPYQFATTMVQIPATSTTVTDSFGTTTTFDANGKRTSVADRYNNTISYTWTGDQLTKVTDTLNRDYTLSYNTQGRLSSISDFGGRTWTFKYDYFGQLIKITTPATTAFPDGRSRRFSYSGNDPQQRFKANLIHAWSPKGDRIATFTYDENDMVIDERIGDESWLMTYSDTQVQTDVTDRSGNSERLTFDTIGQLTEREVYTSGLRSGEPTSFDTTYVWDSSNGMVDHVVYPRGNRTDYTYDSNLNTTEIRHKETDTASNGSSDIVRSFTFGTYSQVTQSVDPRGNTTIYTVDSNGNTTAVGRPTVTSPASQSITETFTYDSSGRILTATDGESRKTQFEYFTTGVQTGYLKKLRQDPAGLDLTTTFDYDEYGNVISVTDAEGNKTTITVDEENYVTEIKAPTPLSYRRRIAYDENRNVTKVETENIDRKGVADSTTPWIATTLAYNELGWLTSRVEQLTASSNATTLYEYEGSGLLTKVTSSEGNVTTFEWDERNLLFKATRGFGTTDASAVQYDYDENGNLEKLTNGRGKATTFDYDLFDRRTKSTNALGHYVTLAYDKTSNLTTISAYDVSQVLQAKTTRHYDEINRLWKSVQDRFGGGLSTTYPATTITRDRGHLVTQVSDPLSNATSTTYDAAGRFSTVTDAAGNKVTYTYDKNGNVTKVEELEVPDTGSSETFTTQFEYDEINRRVKVEEIDRVTPTNVLTTTLEYDSRDNLTFRTDAEGNSKRWTYDLASRLTKFERALQVGTQIDDFVQAIEETFAYDGDHRLTSVTDDNFNNTDYEYDALDRQTKATYKDTKSVTLTFDKADNVATRTDQNGSIVTNTWDDIDRLTSRAIQRGTGVGGTVAEEYTYDALNRIKTAVDNDYQVQLTWDSIGNLLKEKQGYNSVGQEKWKTVTTTYTDASSLTSIDYPSGFSVTHSRDSIYRLKTIHDPVASANVAAFTWKGAGRLAQTNNQNGTITEYAYDGFRRMKSIDHQTSGAQTLHKFEYLYDKVHNRRMEKNSFTTSWVNRLPTAIKTFLGGRNGKGDVYAYDMAYRMVDARFDVTNPATEVGSPGSQTYVKLVGYTLDGVGNRSQLQTTLWGGSPTTLTYASDVVNQYTTIGAVNRAHDNNGNLSDDGTNTYVYDYENHLIEVKLKSTGASIATHAYDAFGRRVEKAVNGGATTRYVLRRQQVIEEWDGGDNWVAEYIYEDGIDRPRAMDRADIADVDGDSNTTEVLRFHYHQNALSSTSEISEPGGAVVEWVTYDVYGAATVRDKIGTVVAQSAIGNPFLYTGREYDPESGKYYYRARTYDPGAGRFLQRDPLGYVDGMGLYKYARSSPATLRDPSGLFPGWLIDRFIDDPEKTAKEVVKGAEVLRGKLNDALETVDDVVDALSGIGSANPELSEQAAKIALTEYLKTLKPDDQETVLQTLEMLGNLPGTFVNESIPHCPGQQVLPPKAANGLAALLPLGALTKLKFLKKLRAKFGLKPGQGGSSGGGSSGSGGGGSSGGGANPTISPQKQAGHIEGTPQHTQRTKVGKPTSTFDDPASANALVQEAWQKGEPVPGRPNVRDYDAGRRIGTGPGGGGQTRVRVHQDSKGRIHGHPAGREGDG